VGSLTVPFPGADGQCSCAANLREQAPYTCSAVGRSSGCCRSLQEAAASLCLKAFRRIVGDTAIDQQKLDADGGRD